MQKGNAIQSVFAPRATAYLTQTSGGVVNLPRRFDGVGALLAYSVPPGTAVSAYVMPATGPQSAGNPLRATVTVTGPVDVVLVQV